MARYKTFIVVFLPAYILFKILASTFGLSGFSLETPGWTALILDLGFWLLSWFVSHILYLTLSDWKEQKQ